MNGPARKPRPRVYVAAPLFSEGEQAFNRRLKEELAAFVDVFLPQEDGQLLVELVERGMAPAEATRSVFTGDLAALDRADVLLLVLDGRAVDEGGAFELGYAYASGKTCVGLQTDPRRLLPTGNNPMIEAACRRIFRSVPELVCWARELDRLLFPTQGDRAPEEGRP